jgi:hypothetical protein
MNDPLLNCWYLSVVLLPERGVSSSLIKSQTHARKHHAHKNAHFRYAMPHSSPNYLREQHVRLFSSSARDSALEHLTHMDRLAVTRLSPRTGGIKDAPDVDFRYRNPENERMTLAMATKLRRECQHEESRIRTENDYLIKKLEVHGSVEERRKHHRNLVPVEEKKPFSEQASNVAARRKEALRVAEANETLMFTMATLQPTVRNDKIKESVRQHNELVKRISRFKPAPRYAGEEILHPGSAPRYKCPDMSPNASRGSSRHKKATGAAAREHGDDNMRSESAGSTTQKLPKIEWVNVSPHDVRVFRRNTDRAVRSVFLRNEREVLREAQAAPHIANVSARRLTWTELGQQASRVPAPPSTPRRT